MPSVWEVVLAGSIALGCALAGAGCGDDGQVIDPDAAPVVDAVPPSDAALPFLEAVAAGGEHTCVLVNSGGYRSVRCWGGGERGQLGYADVLDVGDDEPASSAGDVNVGGTVVQLSTGTFHTCVRTLPGGVRCWGWGDSGRLGYASVATLGDDEVPAVAGDVVVGGAALFVAAGGAHSCGVLETGNVRCWGSGADGRLGYAITDSVGDDETPDDAGDVDVGASLTSVAVGSEHTCVIADTGASHCWGVGESGRLGYASTINIGDDEPPSLMGGIATVDAVVQIVAGGAHTCALLETKAVLCWGDASRGQLGYGNTSDIGDDEQPFVAGAVDVGGPVVEIAAGRLHTCALLEDGGVRCWGAGAAGQLGYGNTADIGDDETPASVGNVDVGGAVAHLSAGSAHTCALLGSGGVRCWGDGGNGRLGYGNTESIGDDESPASAGDVPAL